MSEAIRLDAEALGRLRRLGGDKLVGEMIVLFFEHAPGRVEAAVAAEKAGDLEQVSAAVHSLKSSAGNLGMTVVTHLAEAIERRATDGDAAAVAALLRDLKECFPRWTALLDEEKRRLAP